MSSSLALAALALLLAGPRRAAAQKCYELEPPTCSTTTGEECFDTKSCCMQTNFEIYGGTTTTLGCTANSLAFHEVTGFTVYDAAAWKCDCNCAEGAPTCQTCAEAGSVLDCDGMPMDTWFDACRGSDDYVEVSFEINLQVKSDQYDVGLYIATDGGAALNGDQCIISGLTLDDPDSGEPWKNGAGEEVVGVANKENPGDECWDFIGAGYLNDYPFNRVILKCFDSPTLVDNPDGIDDTPANDGLLDFSVAASFFQNTGDACSYDGPIYLPLARGEITLASSIGKTGSGQFTMPVGTGGFDPLPSALTASQMSEAKDIFQTAIDNFLTGQGILPFAGVSLVVTGISDNGAEDTAATAAYVSFDIRELGGGETKITAIEDSLKVAANRATIASAVNTAASGTSVEASLDTTTITGYVVTTTNGQTPAYVMTGAETREAKAFFADAIYNYLDAGNALPAEVIVDGNTYPKVEVSDFDLQNDKVVYVVRLNPEETNDAVHEAARDTINARIALTGTESTITTAVQAEAATSLNEVLINQLGAAVDDLLATTYDRALHYPPYPGTSSKCWAGQRITLPINVPDFVTPSQTPSISTAPSQMPSTSSAPSSQPSIHPSDLPTIYPSSQPSSVPSENPSISVAPTPEPSEKPSTSTQPSSLPSESPSISSKPSIKPSPKPSVAPSDQPSSIPSESPSREPSDSPTGQPSGVPSTVPSTKPSTSSAPSSIPSVSPSVSTGPSISTEPTWATPFPSEAPSTSQRPSHSPTDSPSVSLKPSVPPTESPSASPSAPPTGSLYYPDWENEEQICVNDGADPTYMKRIQRENYLYTSKKECCETHFWWRVAQCMDNEHRLYTSNGEICDTVVNLEQWDVKYTPQEWDTSDLFDTLQECCNEKFWWDVEGCMAASPKEIVFLLEFDITGLIEPTTCQDADILANALAVAMEVGLDGGDANVTDIGCATLSKNPDTSNPECGGCLAGTTFEGDWPNRPEGYYESYNTSQPTTIKVEVSSQCDASSCPDLAALNAMYEEIWANFETFVDSGSFEAEIISWANERAPPVPELFEIHVVTDSLTTDGTFTNPLADPQDTVEVVLVTTTGSLSVDGLNEEVEVVAVTTTGSFSDSSLVTTGLNAIQIEELMGVYEDAIESSLGLPGSTVIVTGINDDGTVQYEITAYAESSTDANNMIDAATTTLDQPTAMEVISTAVNAELDASPDSDLAAITASIDSNTAGSTSSPSTTSQVTVSGELTVSGIGSYIPAQEYAVMNYFDSALTQELEDQGFLPEGASVVITGIDSDGTVSYDIHFYGTSSAESSTVITQIEASLSLPSTLESISTTVTDSSGILGVSVTGNTQVSTAGLTMTAAEEAVAIADFETAIKDSLGADLPTGATVTVTSIENGVVSYEISMSADTSDDADATVSTIQGSLGNAATLAAITDAVATASETTTITTAGTLSVPGTAGLTMSEADEQEAKEIFADAIESSMGADLPTGSIVTVTSIDNGAVEYFITFPAETTDAATEAAAVQASLSSRVSDITTAVTTAASSSSNPVLANALSNVTVGSNSSGDTTTTTSSMNALSGATVDGNKAGATTQSVVAQVTTSGQLTTTLTGLTNPDEIAEASSYFENAIAATLEAKGALPEGSFVTASIDSNGVVTYTITMHLTPGADNAIIVTGINDSLESSATQAAIADAVADEAVAANSSIAALQSFQVTGFTALESTGVSFREWYPNWLSFGSYCANDGNQPPFMSELGAGEYLFATQQECCDKWYSFADDCVGSSGSPSTEKYFPAYGSGSRCSKKMVKDFASYEQERYDSLAECCATTYSYDMQTCCDSPGMGGCDASGEVVYLPDFYGKQCVQRSKGALANFEEEYANDSLVACCDKFFFWSEANGKCLEESIE